jgi:hypothetical protein
MIKTYFSLGGIAALGGMVWMGAGGCSSDETVTPTGGDGGNGTSSGNTKEGGTQNENDSGSSGNVDSGGSSSGAPKTPITYGQCAAFTKCGGAVIGSWKVTGGCLSEDQFADAKAKCPGLKESNVVIKGDGTLNIDATIVKRDTAVNVTAKVEIPKSCVSLAPDCATVATGLQLGVGGPLKFDKATCAEKGASCECDVESTFAEKTEDAYTISSDGVLTTTGTQTRTYDYCVTANKNVYKETTNDPKTLKLIVEITKQ